MTSEYNVGIYIRLSKEDIDKHEESLSVTNQKNVLEDYAKEQGLFIYKTYIDDGYTGTNYNRPAFKQMIKDIESNKINMVITKDLSRLGRDYIETGEYLEKYFPTHNIRYVSLLDGIDTIKDNSNNDIAPFKAVINDMYSKDNSKKIRTALKTMQLKGKWVGGCPPFGYMTNPQNKNQLIPNKEESEIVKKIFTYASQGNSYFKVAEILTKNNIPTSSMLRNNNRKGKLASLGIWSPKTVKSILTNEVYLGNMIQNKNNRLSYKIRKNEKVPKERWIIVNNTHEPLIDESTFKRVQEILSNSKIRTKKTEYKLLEGILYCHECGHKISICNNKNNSYTACNYYKMHSKNKLCTPHTLNYNILEKEVIKSIKENIPDIIFKNYKINNKDIDSLINIKEKRLDKLYIDYLDNKINTDMYERIKTETKLEINSLLKEKDKINTNILNKIDRNIIVKLINKIEIHQDKEIDIYYNFKSLKE